METFWNRERQFKQWIERHAENGYLLNCIKGSEKSVGWPYLLHRAACSRFTTHNRRSGKNFTTHRYYKVCSTSMDELASWAKRERGNRVPKCSLCF